jgi:hypothetical protein
MSRRHRLTDDLENHMVIPLPSDPFYAPECDDSDDSDEHDWCDEEHLGDMERREMRG